MDYYRQAIQGNVAHLPEKQVKKPPEEVLRKNRNLAIFNTLVNQQLTGNPSRLWRPDACNDAVYCDKHVTNDGEWCPGPESNRHGVATEGF